jgi:hypothetical protein
MSKTDTILVTIRPEHKYFVKRAAKSAGVSVASLARKAVVSVAADLLGETAPTAEEITQGAKNPLAADAAKEGLTPKGYQRKLAYDAKGIAFKPRKGESLVAAAPVQEASATA